MVLADSINKSRAIKWLTLKMNIFDQYYKQYDNWYDRNKFAYLSELEAVRKALPERGKGLEIGVGTGRFAVPLGIAYGVEPSVKMAEIAIQRGVDVQIAPGEKIPFADNEFDYALIAITICFVKNPQKVIAETKRVLKKRGKIILAIVDKNSFLGQFYQKKKSRFYKQANFFSVDEIVDLLKGFDFGNFSFSQTISHLPQKLKKIEKAEGGYGQGGFVVISAYAKN